MRMIIFSRWLRVVVCVLAPVPALAQEKPALALSMRDAVRLALSEQGSLRVGIARESVGVAEARWRESRAAFLPSVDTSLGGENQVLNLAALGFESVHVPLSGFTFPRSVGPFNTVDARMHARQSILDVAAIRQSRASHSEIEIARDEAGEIRDRVAAEIAKLYWTAVRADSAITGAHAAVSWAEASLAEVSQRSAAGKALDIDISRSRVRLASEKQHLFERQMQQRRTAIELLSALNRDLDTPLRLTDALVFTPEARLAPEQALAIAYRSRQEMVTQKQRVESARLRDGAIRSERLPTLASYANAGTLGTGVVNSVGTYDIGISLRIPVFDGGRREARREQTQALLRQEELRAAQLRKQVELEVIEALGGLEVARGQVEISAQEVTLAEQEMAHRQRRYSEGLATQPELIDARFSMARAADSRDGAIYAWNEARIELARAMGTIGELAR